MKTLSFLYRYRRRLGGLSVRQSLRYALKSLYGELVRRRDFDALSLRLVEISLTDRCQCECLHCYAANSKGVGPTRLGASAEFSTTYIERILDQTADIGALDVCFTGGEPLLRADIVHLVGYASSKALLPKINTNGLLLTSTLVKRLKEAGLGWCMVSIDSPDSNAHDRFRQNDGCYQKAVSGLKELVRQRIPCGITTVARRAIIGNGDLRRIVQLGHQLGVDVVRVLFPVLLGRFEGHVEEILTSEERKKVRRLTVDPIVVMENVSESTVCTAGITKLNILANGDVTPCVFVPIVFGNLYRENLKQIWRKMRSFTRLAKPRGRCPFSDKDFIARL